jgi:spore coat protein CotH
MDKSAAKRFLSSLTEARNRFQGIIHVYCLTGNHYPMLLETPKANHGRVMGHISMLSVRKDTIVLRKLMALYFVKGPKDRESRNVAMYLCQELAGVKLNDRATNFDVCNMVSVSFTTHQVRGDDERTINLT